MAVNAPPTAVGSNDGLCQLPEPEELDADYNDAGRVVAYGYTANTVRRLLAAERERCAEEVAMLRRLVRSYEHQAHRSVNDLEFGA